MNQESTEAGGYCSDEREDGGILMRAGEAIYDKDGKLVLSHSGPPAIFYLREGRVKIATEEEANRGVQ